MSNKFGEFWYIPTIDKDGFDIHGANGIVDFETTSEKAIVNCQRRYIAELEANLANALEVSRIKGEELAVAIAENEGLHKRMAYRSKILQKARPIIMAMTEYVFNGSERRLVDLANDIDVALSNREDEQDGYGDE